MNWIVVIARNNIHLTKAAVKSFLAQDIGNVAVLLINNASTDGTAAWMATLPASIRQIHLSGQKSVAESWNYGISWCFKQGADRVLVCNNDVVIGPETFACLSAFCDHKNGVEGLDKSRPAFVTCVGVNLPEQNHHPALEWSYHIRPHPDFSCFMITNGVFDEVGPFDEEMKIAYCEDSDYHVRMHRAGIKAVCVDIPFLHQGAATIKMAGIDEAETISHQAALNRERFYAKYGVRIGTPEYDTLFTPETFGIDAPNRLNSTARGLCPT